MPRPRSTLARTGVLLSLLLLAGHPIRAADPIPYTVTLPDTGETELDAALQASATLIALRDNAPVGPFALIGRARNDIPRLKTALGSFGWYDATIAIRIDGRPLDDPDLPTRLDAAPGPVPVTIQIDRGPRYTIGRIDLQGAIPPQNRTTIDRAIALQPGAPAQAADILAARTRMEDALRATGHALARVDPPIATLDPAAHTLAIAFRIDPGPRVDLGPIEIAGEERVNESFIRRRLLIRQGEPYDPARIEAARQDLAATGVFATVRIRTGATLDPQGQIPIAVDVAERPRRVVSVTAAWSTDLGGLLGAAWQHRNLFGNAEQLNLSANANGIGGSAIRQPGYNITASFVKPDLILRDQTLTLSLQAVQENLNAYDRTAILGGIELAQKLAPEWRLAAGLQAQKSRITQEGVTTDYTLLGLPLSARFDTTGPDPLQDPTAGLRAIVQATPTASLQGGHSFAILQGTAATWLDAANLGAARLGVAPGRTILALRATIGVIQGATTLQIPPDQRLYAGGSATVRGYSFQSIGPRFPDNKPTGGTSLAAASAELRQRIGESWGAVAFLDAGQVTSGTNPFATRPSLGVGTGARYYTGIGPIRLDVAFPLDRRHGDAALQAYIGLGQAF